MKEDLFIYRIIEKSWYNRHFRQRHEVRFERNIQLVLHEFALMKETIHYFEKIEDVKFEFWKTFVRWQLTSKAVFVKKCIFGDKAWNIICQKTLTANDFK